ncbi:hypothetical protein GCM10009623_18590 [Nocardioides aestuarii]|uniref:MOSC domain-containing protein n=1 Tax=Nocardioides aestuarii TaxID=252231 RepID=A0ABW4TMZ7_9ACTN
MEVVRVGFAAVKGAHHAAHPHATVTATGPVGDRVFCLVDPAADRCLRTIEHPALLQASATWDGVTLRVDLPSGTVGGLPEPTGEVRTVDYWGRPTPVAVVGGAWAAAYSDHLGREVLLARAEPGDVVYGRAVTVISTGALAALGRDVDGARFRATIEVSGDDPEPGTTLRVGDDLVLAVRRRVPRCAVVDHHPTTGERDLRLLKQLPVEDGEPVFGVEADVLAPGTVSTGNAVVEQPSR